MGLSKLEIKSGIVSEALSTATQMQASLKSSNSRAQRLRSAIAGSTWEGETKDAITAYLDIITQFHSDLSDVSQKQVDAYQAILDGLSDYESHGSVTKVKSL